ncbi:MAG TPA: DUF5667 domain-containing protein [Verrucomicrobiae bacterium]|nr:DUF5667 domain-containing protein [Verrucomicrobiae bacterium]
MFNFFKRNKAPRELKQLLTPPEEFTTKTKHAFLAVFDATRRRGVAAGAVAARPWSTAVRVLLAGGALVAVLMGVSAYADTANVPADSPLYPLKRLSENVRVALAAPEGKAELQVSLASRRAAEIEDISARKPTSTLIAHLDQDLNTDVDDSLVAAQDTRLGDGNLDTLCGRILSVIATSSVALHEDSPLHLGALARFKHLCVEPAASTTAAQQSATSSPDENRSPDEDQLHVRGGGELKILLKDEQSDEHDGKNNQEDATVSQEVSASTTIIVVSSTNHDEGHGKVDLPHILKGLEH